MEMMMASGRGRSGWPSFAGDYLGVYLVLCLVLFGTALWSLAADGLNPEYLIKNWTTADGLPENSVRAIVETRDGYLWLGTANGLARFDGVRFTVFDSANRPEFFSAA